MLDPAGERLTVPMLVRRWAEEQPEKRFVVTDALSRAGFMVKPEDLVEDGRRKRRKT